ncbi:hypothetical protein BV898_02038 [Hypsibius exemplaris]|uniref:Uncharacterized protein n=1 Tax=Hypsibius exemplaris TaxID=2072580 RepID=A0A1W0X9L1_HYPEX|nr:hypothetical protein BV898_02038 [Hypsibius exemplaris]
MRKLVVVCAKPAAILAILVQGGILDYYLIHHNGWTWAPWIAADVVCVAAIFCCIYYSRRYYDKYDREVQDEKDLELTQGWKDLEEPKVARGAPATLPLAYIGWLVYSGLLVARIVMIFKTFGSTISGEEVWGTNMLEFVIGGTAGIFAFLLATVDRKPTPSQKVCLKFLQHHVLLEIIDSVEFLTILFTAEHKLTLPGYVYDLILAFSCINMILPTLGLYQLSATNFKRAKPRENFYILQTILSTIFGNLPFLIIRVVLWSEHKFTNALFVMKNIIAMVQNVVELIHYFFPEKGHEHKATELGHSESAASRIDGGMLPVPEEDEDQCGPSRR